MSRIATKTALATLLSAGLVQAAAAQVITGKVTDATGTAPLQGAIVSVEGMNRSATTNRFGEYRISNVPAGDYTLSVSYIGTDTVVAEVVVPEAGTTQDFILGGDVRYLDNILVVGSAAAKAGAINQQRAADSIISVIDSDGLGNFPDTTVADSLSRVPGLSIETDQGEGRYVSIRGINTDLVGTSINGVRTPTPEDRRGILLDGIPSDLLDGIEVQKSLTPDLDADSLGGFINLKTLSAFDRNGRFIRAKVEGAYNEITENVSPKVTLTYADTFNDTFGMAVSLNYQSLDIESHNNEAGEFGLDDTTGFFFLNDDYETRWYELTRERLGVVANFDWRVNENTDLYLRTVYNDYEDDEIRNKFEYRDLDDVEDNGTINASSIDVPLNEVDAETRLRAETRQIQTYALGGQTQFDDWTFDYELAYAYAEQDDSDNHDVTFRFEDIQDAFPGNVNIDYSSPETPRVTGDSSIIAAIYDPANYELDEFEEEKTLNEDEEISAKFDVSKESILGDTPVTWKTGFKYRDREKTRDVNKTFSGTADGFSINAADFGTGTFIPGWRLATPAPTFPDANLTAALRNNALGNLEVNEDDTALESLAEDYMVEEQILAVYGMGTFDIGNLTLVAGVRIEQTDVNLTGNNFAEEADPASVAQVSFSDDYTHVLPSVNAKYQFSENLIGRAAYYAAVVRPGFGEMAPFAVLNDDRDEAFVGNPNLDPYEADNFDISLEYYPTELSVISGGIFAKQIDNAIYGATFDIADLPGSVDLTSALTADQIAGLSEVETFINVDTVDLIGAEFNYVQGLDFLGGFWEGFLVSGNLTLTDSEATLPEGRTVPLLAQSETIWNLSLGYDKGPWDLRIAANYRGDYLDSIEGEDFDRFTDDRLLVDLSAKYDVSDKLQIYLEGKNITDEPEFYYFGGESRLSQYDEFGSTWIAGARFTF